MTTHSFSLIVEGQTIHVTYTPNYFTDYGHLAFTSPHNPPQRILISESGYRSHFAPMWQIEEFDSRERYAEEVVRTLRGTKAKAPTPAADNPQLSLF